MKELTTPRDNTPHKDLLSSLAKDFKRIDYIVDTHSPQYSEQWFINY